MHNKDERARILDELEDLQEEIGTVDVPLSYTDDLYRLRNHVEFVKQLVMNAKTGAPAAEAADVFRRRTLDDAVANVLREEAARVGAGLVFGSHAEARDWLVRITLEFNDRPHRALPMMTDPVTGRRRHMSPNERMAQFVASGWVRQPLAGDDLVDAFRVHERKTVDRGVVRVMKQAYHHPLLDDIRREEVLVAYDMHDGTRVWVKDLDGRLLCQATFYESRAYRCQSFVEMALETRANAQLKRLGKKADEIEAQRPAAVLDAPSAPQIDIAMALYGDAIDAEAREVMALPEGTEGEEGTPENVAALPRKYNDSTDLALFLYGDEMDRDEDEDGFEVAAG